MKIIFPIAINFYNVTKKNVYKIIKNLFKITKVITNINKNFESKKYKFMKTNFRKY